MVWDIYDDKILLNEMTQIIEYDKYYIALEYYIHEIYILDKHMNDLLTQEVCNKHILNSIYILKKEYIYTLKLSSGNPINIKGGGNIFC